MTIIESTSLFGDTMVTVIDEENNTAESMLKSTYEARQAEQSTLMISADE